MSAVYRQALPGSRATNNGPVRVDIGSKKQMAKLYRDLRKVAPDVAKETRKRFKAAAQPALNEARARQPKKTGELRRKTKIYVARGQVSIRSRAQHARISEFGGRHPVFGDWDKWVDQKAIPAILPAAAAHRAQFIKEANQAVYRALKEAGFR